MSILNFESYSIENLVFLNMATHMTMGLTYYNVELDLSENEKLLFLDLYTNGEASKLLELFRIWNDEKEDLPKDRTGYVKTVSLKAWIKRNKFEMNHGRISDDSIKYNFLRQSYDNFSDICGMKGYNVRHHYTDEHIVNQWFHSLCNILKSQEYQYNRETSPFYIKLEKVREYGEQFGFMDSKTINDIVWNRKEDVTEEYLDYVIKCYQKIESVYNFQTEDLKEYEAR